MSWRPPARAGGISDEARAWLAQIPESSFVFGHHEPCTMGELADVVVALDDRIVPGRCTSGVAAGGPAEVHWPVGSVL